jgi:hypothetical protein
LAVLFDQRHQLRPRHHPIDFIQKVQMLVRACRSRPSPRSSASWSA